MKQSFKVLFFGFSVLMFISCNEQNQSRAEEIASPAQLMQADNDFSKMSEEKGMRKAFTHFMAREGVLLRPDERPMIGADAIQYISEVDDSDYSVLWHPIRADISDDGQLGYTYGIYEVKTKDTTVEGTYINVWKKQNGQWKFVINTGNQGLSPE
ncbi:MAG: hypothetical protein J0H55_02285 [Chitinophagaceae bacterium]|nr:hypothetical protein [Chitinophagaceae bacterium]